jgi:hypothetical protein
LSRTSTHLAPRRDGPADRPGDRRSRRRIVIFIVVVVFAEAMFLAGCDLQTVLTTLIGVGLTGATIARWVVDGVSLPNLSMLLPIAGEQK